MSASEFVHGLRFDDLPAAVVERAKLTWLDLVGCAAAGLATDLSHIVRDHAARHMGPGQGGGAHILLDGRKVGPAAAAYAGASTIDAYDAHDGHALTKGHAGVAILPALLAFAELTGRNDGRELMAGLVLGYEIATRAGIALHAGVADYHTSGAWNALGCAAVGARMLGLDDERTRHALGIAEYHGPRSQMMRCIAHPTMLKDGSGWGALAGVSAALLAADGFTGAPAITTDGDPWSDLGRRWRLLEQYMKPQPVCRWAQPAIQASIALCAAHAVNADEIEAVEIRTFGHAAALGTRPPSTTEEAQYALGFPVAAALRSGVVGAAEITGQGLSDPGTLSILARIAVVEEPAFSARFPAERLAAVTLRLRDGRTLASPATRPRGDPDDPLPEAEIRTKFAANARALPPGRAAGIEAAIGALDRDVDAGPELLRLLLRPAA